MLHWTIGTSLDSNPLDSDFCANIVKSAKRKKSQPVKKKKPITSEIIKNILDIHSKENAEVRHIEFCGSYLKIFIPRSKTHIDKEITYTFHYASGSKFCPVGVLRRYLNLSGTDLQSTLPLFRPLVFQRSSFSYSLKGGKLSYTTCRDILRETFSGLDYNPNDYFLHSLRAGDITSAVHQSSNSISERLLKKHGRWKSDSAKDVYFEESLENRLQVTK